MRIIFCLMVFLFIGKNTMLAQQLSSFVEYGAALHTGDNTPLCGQPWQDSFARQQYLHTWRNILQTPTWKMEV